MTFTLEATSRTERGKQLGTLRAHGKIPAVLYGPSETSVALTVDRIQFEKLFKEAGESSIIALTGLGDPKEVLVHDVAFDARRGGIVHIDFYAVEAGKEITVDVPLSFIGDAPALKLGGTLTKVLYEIKVTCTPSVLPKEIVVDITPLADIEAQIHVRDLVLPPGVRVVNDANDVVALIQAVAEENETSSPVDMSAIEVEKKGKTETTE